MTRSSVSAQLKAGASALLACALPLLAGAATLLPQLVLEQRQQRCGERGGDGLVRGAFGEHVGAREAVANPKHAQQHDRVVRESKGEGEQQQLSSVKSFGSARSAVELHWHPLPSAPAGAGSSPRASGVNATLRPTPL